MDSRNAKSEMIVLYQFVSFANLSFCGVLALISDRSRSALVIIGFVALIGAVALMYRHKFDADEVIGKPFNRRTKLYEQRKFRRRSIVSAMIGSKGILMIALNWAYEPLAFVTLTTLVLVLLLGVMLLAFLDLMSVSLHSVETDDQARTELINEYLRQRKKLLDKANGDEESRDTVEVGEDQESSGVG